MANIIQAISALSILEPFRRTALRIPFLYQRIASPTPLTALISPKSSSSSLAVVHLDGSLDWILARKALLAWTGQTLSVRPIVNRSMVCFPKPVVLQWDKRAKCARAWRTGAIRKPPAEACLHLMARARYASLCWKLEKLMSLIQGRGSYRSDDWTDLMRG